MLRATGKQKKKKEPSVVFRSEAIKSKEATISQFSGDQPSGANTGNSAQVLQEHPTGCRSWKKLPTEQRQIKKKKKKRSAASPQSVGQFAKHGKNSLIIKAS